MNLLILGRGKTGSAVAAIARERGHSVTVLGAGENENASALTPAFLAPIHVAIDFTTPTAAIENLRALLAAGAKVVVGTTGWQQALPEVTELARKHNASLLHGTNFSLGVQAFFRAARELAASLPGYELRIEETHHITKKDAPSGTALTLQQVVEEAAHSPAPIRSHREGDAPGLHTLTLRSPDETIQLTHEARSRTPFAEGAVRAAEWLEAQDRPGVRVFAEMADLLRKNNKQSKTVEVDRMLFLDLYQAAHNNAIELVQEAEILFERGRYCRAYALAFTSLEELSKSQIAADVYTGLIDHKQFRDICFDHRKKVGKMAWATEDAKNYLTAPDGVYLDVKAPKFASRNDSMYVSLQPGQTNYPSQVIGRGDAEGIIHTVNIALDRIYEVTEVWGHQIGTKGFMK